MLLRQWDLPLQINISWNGCELSEKFAARCWIKMLPTEDGIRWADSSGSVNTMLQVVDSTLLPQKIYQYFY